MIFLLFVALVVIGVGAGILGGLIGVSGGVITIPCLVFLFKLYGFPEASLMQMAVGTSMAAMVFNTLSSMKAHYNQRSINWSLVKWMFPGLLLGCLVGAFVAHLMPGKILQMVFGGFAALLGIYFYRYRKLPHVSPDHLPAVHTLNTLGFGVGALSNILGIGGGTLTIPLFIKLKIPMKSAAATSTATGFIISFVGAFSYLFFGLGTNDYNMTIGYIYLPAFIVLAITTFITAPAGARLSQTLPTHRLKKVFALCLVFTGFLLLTCS